MNDNTIQRALSPFSMRQERLNEDNQLNTTFKSIEKRRNKRDVFSNGR